MSSPVSAFKPDGTSTARTGIFDSLTAAMNFFQPSVERTVKPDAEQAVNDERRFLQQRPFQRRQIGFGRGEVEHFRRGGPVEKFPRGAGVVAVVAFAGENQDRVVRAA